MATKDLVLNAFGIHGAIIRNPHYIFYVVNKGKPSEKYGDNGLPSRTDEGLDHMIEWIMGHVPKKSEKPHLILINIEQKRKLKKIYGTRGDNTIIELKYISTDSK